MASYLAKLPSLAFLPKSSVRFLRFSRVATSAALLKTPPPAASSYHGKTFSHLFQECASGRSLDPGKQAHARMIVSGFRPTVFVTNCLIQLYIRCSCLDLARAVFDEMPVRDTVSSNAEIFGYWGIGEISVADAFFREMPEKDVVSWNSMMSGFLLNGKNLKCIEIFLEMRMNESVADHTSFAVILKACSGLEKVHFGVQIHGLAVKMGFDRDVVTASALVNMYGKCRKLCWAVQLFQDMSERNGVSWSAIISGCIQNDDLIMGLEMYRKMLRSGYGASQSTYASTLRSCAGLSAFEIGSQLHAHTLKNDFGGDIVVATATLDMYAKCERYRDARKVFDLMPRHSLQSFNAMIVGYARGDHGHSALELLCLLQNSGLGFDEITLSGGLSACAGLNGFVEGLQVHALTIKCCFGYNVTVQNALLDMYGKCGALTEAYRVFIEMDAWDAVSWNAVIAAHEQNDRVMDTVELYVSMLRSRIEPDEYTYGSVLKACAGRQALNSGMAIHNRIIKSGMGLDLSMGSALVDMYSKCGMMEEAEKIHRRITEQTVVSWNTMLSGFTMLKQSEVAQGYFARMLEMGVEPDNFTYATILDSCANLATMSLGKQIHAKTIKLELQKDVYVCSTLVDMYSKCGELNDCRLMFEKAQERDFVTWNAMICAYSHHGRGQEALEVFERMQRNNVKPNHATFVSVLRACAHIGVPEKGLEYFSVMSRLYCLEPQLEHYSCMVDILGRSGRTDKALKLINEMPFEADAVIWRSLLSACSMHSDVATAEKAANKILDLDPEDSAAYVLLCNIYANAGMWKQVTEMRKVMRHCKLRKEPGCSWIELKDEVHTFLAGERAHPRSDDIYAKLYLLMSETRGSDYAPEADLLVVEEAEKIEQDVELVACLHS